VIIIIDIDDTLADTSHREHLIQSQGWDAFHAAGKDDPPIKAMIRLIDVLCEAEEGLVQEIVALTARPAKYRNQTMEWLIKHNIYIDDIIMRPDNDFSKSKDLKVRLAKEYFGDRFKDIALVIDDHEEVCASFRAEGITCLQVLK
jgi:hypothetical protein